MDGHAAADMGLSNRDLSDLVTAFNWVRCPTIPLSDTSNLQIERDKCLKISETTGFYPMIQAYK